MLGLTPLLDLEKASEWLRKSVNMKPYPDNYNSLYASCLIKMNRGEDLKEARAWLEKAKQDQEPMSTAVAEQLVLSEEEQQKSESGE